MRRRVRYCKRKKWINIFTLTEIELHLTPTPWKCIHAKLFSFSLFRLTIHICAVFFFSVQLWMCAFYTMLYGLYYVFYIFFFYNLFLYPKYKADHPIDIWCHNNVTTTTLSSNPAVTFYWLCSVHVCMFECSFNILS